MASNFQREGIRLSYWAKLLIFTSGFIILGFAQFSLRGFVNYRSAPLVMHLHAVAMTAWLGLLVTQAVLAGRVELDRRGGLQRPGGLALHRRLGWASAGLLPLIIVLSSMTCVAALRTGMFPPFFTGAYFLALVHIGVLVFAAMVIAAILKRGEPDWHRRLWAGSTVLLLEPALGRVLPMPLIMPWGEWLSMAIQLGVVVLIMRHDRQTLGRVHPATMVSFIAVALNHIAVELLAVTPWWTTFAARIAAA